MKTNHLLLTIIISTLLLFSCGDRIEYTLIVNTSFQLYEGETGTIQISAGNGGYQVVSFDPSILTATVQDSTITILGIKEGETTLTLTDATDQTETIYVTVGIPPVSFTKTLPSSAVSTILSGFGLSWEETKDGERRNVIIKPDGASKLAVLGYYTESSILTSEMVVEIIDRTQGSAEYFINEMPFNLLGVIYNDHYYLLHIANVMEEGDVTTIVSYYIKARKLASRLASYKIEN